MFRNLFNRKATEVQALFLNHFVEVKALYVMQFNRIACVSFVSEIDSTQTLAHIRNKFERETISFLQHSFFDHAAGKMFFNNAILVLRNKRIIEVSGNYCQLLHTADQYNWAIALVKEIAVFKEQPVTASPATVIGFARKTALN